MNFLRNLYNGIMGVKPYNTIFSFNYWNIKPIVGYMKNVLPALGNNNILLDIGCGHSPYYDIFKDCCNKYMALDYKDALPTNETRNIIQLVGVSENIPLENQSINIALSNQVLEHVSDLQKSLQETYRVLKTGGYFIGSVPHLSPIHLEPHDYRRLTYYGLKNELEKAGFSVVEIKGNPGLFRSLAFLMMMDFYLDNLNDEDQKFYGKKHLLLFWANCLINVFAFLLDKIFRFKNRSPSNYCWVAKKM